TVVGIVRARTHDSAPRVRVDVDVVDPDPSPSDHLQLRRLVDQAGVEMRAAADDDRVVVPDARREITVGVAVHVEALAQEVDPGLRDRLPDEDLHTETGSAYASRAAV